jgi:hypothetical protein
VNLQTAESRRIGDQARHRDRPRLPAAVNRRFALSEEIPAIAYFRLLPWSGLPAFVALLDFPCPSLPSFRQDGLLAGRRTPGQHSRDRRCAGDGRPLGASLVTSAGDWDGKGWRSATTAAALGAASQNRRARSAASCFSRVRVTSSSARRWRYRIALRSAPTIEQAPSRLGSLPAFARFILSRLATACSICGRFASKYCVIVHPPWLEMRKRNCLDFWQSLLHKV